MRGDVGDIDAKTRQVKRGVERIAAECARETAASDVGEF
jgi:hypothetical protein